MQSVPAILWQYSEPDKNRDSSLDLTSDKLVYSFLLGFRLLKMMTRFLRPISMMSDLGSFFMYI